MGTEHTFYDYVNDAGENTIYAWLNSIPKGAKQKLNNRLLHLEGTKPGSWARPLVDTLTQRACDGLFEIRASVARLQYRILGYHGPGRGTPTLLWAFIKDGGPVPESDCSKAHEIRNIVEANPEKYREEHRYG